ncbi:MAG: hydroxymethylbilane synthase [Elusimicrobiota bacterium]
MPAKTLRLGTRGSALALAQAGAVRAKITALDPESAVELVVIKTTGDALSETPLSVLGGKGIFIKEIEEALLDGRVDLAVHSLKDLPVHQPDGLLVAAVLEREDPRDCVVSRFGEQLLELPRGAVVGTGSPRRRAQILAAKKSIRVEDMRGNLDTRLKKVLNGDLDSIVVALAGVRRLGREADVSEILPLNLMLPAPGQGCLGVETREKDAAVRELVARLNHAPSARAAAAERAFLASLGGGCRVPKAACSREEGGKLKLDGLVISEDGKTAVRGSLEGDPAQAAHIGSVLGERLLGQGAAELLSSSPDRPAAGA